MRDEARYRTIRGAAAHIWKVRSCHEAASRSLLADEHGEPHRQSGYVASTMVCRYDLDARWRVRRLRGLYTKRSSNVGINSPSGLLCKTRHRDLVRPHELNC